MGETTHSVTSEYARRLREHLLNIDPDMATDDELFFNTIDGETDIAEQLRKIVRHAIENEAMAAAMTQLREDMKARRLRLEARAEACRAHVRDTMEALAIARLPAPDFTASVRDTPPSVRVTDANALPADYQRIKTESEPDLVKIGRALKDGVEIPGAVLSNPRTTLVIKRT